ncbi:unnamed protein product [Rotaria sp. Silwood2]|nr:unnamed protein product [Rotaria sp. Silwood2]CAF4203774.1 unnamed protein product [Rotaria sp. Silwood2]
MHRHLNVILFVVHSIHSEDDDINHDTLVDEDAMDVDSTIVTDKDSSSFVTFDCIEPVCVMQFRREDRLRAHLLLDSHKIVIPPFRLLDKAAIMYKESLENDNPKQIPVLSAVGTTTKKLMIPTVDLEEGWALFRLRANARFTAAQRSYLN